MNWEKVIASLEDNFSEDIEKIRDVLRIPSVSYTGEGIRETAENLTKIIRELGGTSELVETSGHPVVFGEIDDDCEHTILIYGMYDVMPADEEGWTVDPWVAEIKDLPKFGKCIVNRGAVNTKGPLAAFFNVLRAFKDVNGKLPVNLIFAIEGEEEMGSRHFPEFLEQYKEKLSKAQAVLFPFFDQDEEGMPSLTLGTKGLFYFELIATGGEWGGPQSRGIHGSFNAWVKNPAWRLVKALSTMIGDDEEILVEGLKEGMKPISEKELTSLKTQIDDGLFDDKVFKENYDVQTLKYDGEPLEIWEKLFSQPQLNIDGIFSGYSGPETKTLLPHKATVKMDVRMVPDMEPDKVEQSIRDHLDKHGFEDIELKTYNKYYWSKVNLEEKVVQSMVKSYQAMGKEPQLWPLNPGSAPYYVFERYLKIPYVTGGMGHGSRQHSSDEYITVDGILDFEKSMVHFFKNYIELNN